MSTFTPASWTVTTDNDGRETYTKDLGLVTVVAEWDPTASLGTIAVEDAINTDGLGTRYAAGSDAFRDAPAFWIAANLVADTAAAPLPVVGHVIGGFKVDPADFLEAELEFVIDDGRDISVSLVDHQASELMSGIHSIDKHVWEEQRNEDEDEDEDDADEDDDDVDDVDDAAEDDPYLGPDRGGYREVLPYVTAAETLALLETLTSRFGAVRDDINVSGGGSWIVVHGDDVVTGILGRQQEFDAAIGVKWRYTTDSDYSDGQCLKIQYYPKGQYQQESSG